MSGKINIGNNRISTYDQNSVQNKKETNLTEELSFAWNLARADNKKTEKLISIISNISPADLFKEKPATIAQILSILNNMETVTSNPANSLFKNLNNAVWKKLKILENSLMKLHSTKPSFIDMIIKNIEKTNPSYAKTLTLKINNPIFYSVKDNNLPPLGSHRF